TRLLKAVEFYSRSKINSNGPGDLAEEHGELVDGACAGCVSACGDAAQNVPCAGDAHSSRRDDAVAGIAGDHDWLGRTGGIHWTNW
ncbi:MAG: hypothetical protein M3O72_02640, partial [Verrucomicrobiota bacterium]|nr:hypothetical protein [Verrucomicrobiota bacterium]